MTTAAAIIIGNEILTGKFPDENGPYLVGRLRTLGVDLLRISVIPDAIDIIAAEVRACAGSFDHVFTSGGVGPTHDDVTIDAIARAFDVGLELRDDLVALLDKFSLPKNEATLRLAMLPVGAELVRHEALSYPVIRMRNVFVLPGVPRLFRNKFEALADRFVGDAVATARIYTDEQEWDIAERLTAVAARHPAVAIGSYPRFGEGNYRVILTLESRDRDALVAADADLRLAIRSVDPVAS
jgi:molybdenum cofactor synthesis domain-containing protein